MNARLKVENGYVISVGHPTMYKQTALSGEMSMVQAMVKVGTIKRRRGELMHQNLKEESST